MPGPAPIWSFPQFPSSILLVVIIIIIIIIISYTKGTVEVPRKKLNEGYSALSISSSFYFSPPLPIFLSLFIYLSLPGSATSDSQVFPKIHYFPATLSLTINELSTCFSGLPSSHHRLRLWAVLQPSPSPHAPLWSGVKHLLIAASLFLCHPLRFADLSVPSRVAHGKRKSSKWILGFRESLLSVSLRKIFSC